MASVFAKRAPILYTTREVGKIGGNMVKKMVRFAEEEMDKRNGNFQAEE